MFGLYLRLHVINLIWYIRLEYKTLFFYKFLFKIVFVIFTAFPFSGHFVPLPSKCSDSKNMQNEIILKSNANQGKSAV